MKYQRKKLPTNRRSVTHEVVIGDTELFLILGLHEDGSPGELFVRTRQKNGDFPVQGWCDLVGELISMNLQAGIPVDVIARHLVGKSFKPDGLVKGQEQFAKSIPAYIGKWLIEKGWENG